MRAVTVWSVFPGSPRRWALGALLIVTVLIQSVWAIGISISASAEAVCGEEFSHVLTVTWSVTDAEGGVRVTITATLPDGSTVSETRSEPRGEVTLELPLPGGGEVLVEVRAESSTGTASASARASLGPCEAAAPEARLEDEDTDPGLVLSPSVEARCERGRSHVLRVSWQVQNAPEPLIVRVSVLVGEATLRQEAASPAGRASFPLNLPEGGGALVLGVVEPRGRSTSAPGRDATGEPGAFSARLVVALPPCEEPPRPEPGAGFTAPPAGSGPIPQPPVTTETPKGPVRETDVVHLGGTPEGPTPTVFVTAVGTGAAVRLLSWTLDPGDFSPVLLKTSVSFPGFDVRLLALKGEISPDLSINLLLSAVRREDGTLWLTTWRVEEDGTFQPIGSVGYGTNADVSVEEYALAYRALAQGGAVSRFQVVTPVRTQGDRLRVITWSVDAASGELVGRRDSGFWAAAQGNLSAAHLGQGRFIVTYSNADKILRFSTFTLSSADAPQGASAATPLDLRGQKPVEEEVHALASSPLTAEGLLTAVRVGIDFRLIVWESRFEGLVCDGGCLPFYQTYRITDSKADEEFGLGVDIGLPPRLTGMTQGGDPVQPRGILTDNLWEDIAGVGGGAVVTRTASPPYSIIASVTKVMTLLLAVEAVEAGQVSLDDMVVVSENAAGKGGSRMGLEAGEVQSLNTLLHGLMMESGNDAATAIAEHIAGTEEAFAALMNARAQALGLSANTKYRDSFAGGVSVPQDQVTLWRYAWANYPLFRKYPGALSYSACGQDSQGKEKCWNLNRSPSDYPGIEGWKTGNGGLKVEGFEPIWCPSVPGGCLVAQATRLTRTFVAEVQRSGDRWTDVKNLLDYGYRKLFTPDMVESINADISIAQDFDFALDAITDTAAITATVFPSGELEVCSWEVVADFGKINRLRCAQETITDLTAGPAERVRPTQLDMARLSTLLREGDYLVGRLVYFGSLRDLRLTLWQVAPKFP